RSDPDARAAREGEEFPLPGPGPWRQRGGVAEEIPEHLLLGSVDSASVRARYPRAVVPPAAIPAPAPALPAPPARREPARATPDELAAEGRLVELARAGDDEAFAELVRIGAPAALGAARRITRDAALAEDAAQEAFIRAHRALGDYR